jgi:TRAP-type C4-dicarboxylate transport system permease small subunit
VETPTTDDQEHDPNIEKPMHMSALSVLLLIVHKLSVSAQVIAGITLAFMMVVTLGDIILRYFGRPILGAYEIISFCGGIVVGLAIPYTSWMKGHIYVDVFFEKTKRLKGQPISRNDIVNIVTRFVSIGLFILIGWSFFSYADSLFISREVSQTLRIPFYPVAYGLGISSYIQSVLLLCEILKIVGGENE